MADQPSSSRRLSASPSTIVKFRKLRTSSSQSSEHSRCMSVNASAEGDDEVVLLSAQGTAEREPGTEGASGSTTEQPRRGGPSPDRPQHSSGASPRKVVEAAALSRSRQKVHSGPETQGAGHSECEPDDDTELGPGTGVTPGDQPLKRTPSQSSDSSDLFRNYVPRYRRWLERPEFRICLVAIICLVFVTAIIAIVITVIHSLKPTPATPVPLPPWLPWRNRTDDNGLPRLLLWEPRVSRNNSLSLSVDSDAGPWSETIQCELDGRDVEVCEMTNDRSRLMRSDAVVFYAEYLDQYDIPAQRAAPQMWVFWARADPPPMGTGGRLVNSSLPLPLVANLFNWTMGRRDDADVVIPYKTWRCDASADETVSAYQSRLTEQPRRDTAWLVDDCEENRFESEVPHSTVYGEGTVYIRLFPACGASECGSPSECIGYIAQRYHFLVISLEPVCFQSAYELIYEAFKYDVVPVILTPPGATLEVPEHSVVSSAELHGKGQLAKYLRTLLDDPEKYNSYFAWKRNCFVVTTVNLLCPLCHALWETPMRQPPHPNVLEWWTRRNKCRDEPLFGLDSEFIQEL
ncbi:glycoprotein 3-alpha-L-fucosyltransferase A-like [Dermacentor albipictus]|uniref:glycoprotein 3-alpha-L-fucosyltransferase A-like n=1 Tax=Dermacentor albipictus TaxID=60249 RepID=UPI0031FE3760